jgi:hypothetical protein
MTMHDAEDLIAVWQSFAPIVAGIATLVVMKWMSRRWTAATALRTVRVTSRLGPRRGRF